MCHAQGLQSVSVLKGMCTLVIILLEIQWHPDYYSSVGQNHWLLYIKTNVNVVMRGFDM